LSKKLLSGGEVSGDEVVRGNLNANGDVRTARAKEIAEGFGLARGHERVMRTGGDEDAATAERAGCSGLVEDHHGTQENGMAERFGAELEEGGGDVGAVRKADGGQACRIDFVVTGGGDQEIGECVRAAGDVVEIENALGKATEEAELAVLVDVTSRAEDGGAWGELFSEWEQVEFVAAGAVEEQEGRSGGRSFGLEEVVIGGEGHRMGGARGERDGGRSEAVSDEIG